MEEGVSSEVERYLEGVRGVIEGSKDPHLKREEKKLIELLDSFNKLKLRFDESCEGRRELENVPEIYAILHPEIYADVREKEKVKLGEKLARTTLSDLSKGTPPLCKTGGVYNVYDLRQVEKERFARLIGSAPSRLDQGPERKGAERRVAKTPTTLNDIRQKEKERLATIFATSIGTKINDNKYNCRRPTPISDKNNSPRLHLIHPISQCIEEKEGVMRSVSTQTEESHFSPSTNQITDWRKSYNANDSPVSYQNNFSSFSPHGDRIDEVRSKQKAYAEELRLQIEEKHRLEEGRRRKERAEDEARESSAMQMEREIEEKASQRETENQVLSHRLMEMELEAEQRKLELKRRRQLILDPAPTSAVRFPQRSQMGEREEERKAMPPKERSPSPVSPALLTHTRFKTNKNLINDKVAAKSRGSDEIGPRSPSPPIPALLTDSIIKKNIKSNKLESIKVGSNSDGKGVKLRATTARPIQALSINNKLNCKEVIELRESDRILTELGTLRRQLMSEHLQLEQKLTSNTS